MDAALEEEREAARRGALLDKRRWRKDQREQLDEMLPKATGRYANGLVQIMPVRHKSRP
jgi:hypothetical protein